MIVIAPDRVRGMAHGPAHAFAWVRAVVNQVSQAKADIVGLVDGRQGWPVCVDVRDDKYPHARASHRIGAGMVPDPREGRK